MSQHKFPKYLNPENSKTALEWLGRRLQEIRGSRTLSEIAKSTKEIVSPTVDVEQIRNLEKGIFHLTLGRLRTIISSGYGADVSQIFSQCFEENKGKLDESPGRPYLRDYHYSIHRKKSGDKSPTPILVGGDPRYFLWGVIMRQLKGQPLVTEYLELAPYRKNKSSGHIESECHPGAEVLHVIHGTVDVHMDGSGEPYADRSHGDTVHINSNHIHRVENRERNTPALLLIVRLPDCKQFSK